MTQQSLHKLFIACAGFIAGAFVVALAWHSVNVSLISPKMDTSQIGAASGDNDETIYSLKRVTVPDAYGQTNLLHLVDSLTGKVLYASQRDANGGLVISIGKGDDSGTLTVHDVNAAGDASATTDVMLLDGVENIRGSFSNHVSPLSIQIGGNLNKVYGITPRYMSDACSKDSWPPSPSPVKTTQLIGITVESNYTSKNFDLPKAVSVPCDFDPNIGQMNPGFHDVGLGKNTAHFFLPDGTRTDMEFDPEKIEFTVNFLAVSP